MKNFLRICHLTFNQLTIPILLSAVIYLGANKLFQFLDDPWLDSGKLSWEKIQYSFIDSQKATNIVKNKETETTLINKLRRIDLFEGLEFTDEKDPKVLHGEVGLGQASSNGSIGNRFSIQLFSDDELNCRSTVEGLVSVGKTINLLDIQQAAEGFRALEATLVREESDRDVLIEEKNATDPAPTDARMNELDNLLQENEDRIKGAKVAMTGLKSQAEKWELIQETIEPLEFNRGVLDLTVEAGKSYCRFSIISVRKREVKVQNKEVGQPDLLELDTKGEYIRVEENDKELFVRHGQWFCCPLEPVRIEATEKEVAKAFIGFIKEFGGENLRIPSDQRGFVERFIEGVVLRRFSNEEDDWKQPIELMDSISDKLRTERRFNGSSWWGLLQFFMLTVFIWAIGSESIYPRHARLAGLPIRHCRRVAPRYVMREERFKFAINLLPVLGLFGTIIGLIEAFSNNSVLSQLFGSDTEKSAIAVRDVLGNLSFAFDTTFLGLLYAIILLMIRRFMWNHTKLSQGLSAK